MKLNRPVSAISAGSISSIVLSTCTSGRGRRRRSNVWSSQSRGGLVDEDALLAAIRSGHVAAAGLDSFAVEPLPAAHPFRAEPQLVLSPHIGGVTADAYVKMGVAAAKNALAVLNA